MDFYKPKEGGVEHYATKYDDCVAKATGKPYRSQKGSGRSEVITKFWVDGRTVGEITALAAPEGYDPNFVVGALLKHSDSTDSSFTVEPPAGKTMAEIKAIRQPRKVDPAVAEKREAAKAAAAAKKAEREAAKGQKAEQAAAAKAEKAAQREAAKAAKADAPTKGKGKGKAAAPAGEAAPQ